jgi:hypothetical protein
LRTDAKFTVTLGISRLQNSAFGFDWRVVMAGALVSVIPVLILFLIAPRHFYRGVGAGGVKFQMADVLSARELNRATLARQMLLARERVPAAVVVERLCGMQAQEARPPFVGVWTRAEGFARAELHGALHSRDVVRATLLRGTLHLMSGRDYAALRMAIHPVMGDALRVLGDRAAGLELDQVLPAARRLLDGQPLTFGQLRPLLQAEFPEVNERALGYAVRTHLPLVMLPTGDRWGFPSVASFTLADDWLGLPLSEDPSPEPLVRRYLAAFGPATAADVQAWSGLQGMKGVLDGMRGELRTFRDEGRRELFDLEDALRPGDAVPAPVRFLPEFDNLLLSHANRRRVIADEHRQFVYTKNLRVHATFLVDGVVAGTWKVARTRGRATLTMTPFAPLPRDASKELAAEGESLIHFLEEDASDWAVDLVSPR